MLVYHGTIIKNYRTCLVKKSNMFFYQKSREKKTKTENLDYTDFEDAAIYAMIGGLERLDLNDVPIILESELDVPNQRGVFPKNGLFPVNKLWVPNENFIFPYTANDFLVRSNEKYFRQQDPTDDLTEEQFLNNM